MDNKDVKKMETVAKRCLERGLPYSVFNPRNCELVACFKYYADFKAFDYATVEADYFYFNLS